MPVIKSDQRNTVHDPPTRETPKNVPTLTSPRAPWRDRDDRHRKPALLPTVGLSTGWVSKSPDKRESFTASDGQTVDGIPVPRSAIAGRRGPTDNHRGPAAGHFGFSAVKSARTPPGDEHFGQVADRPVMHHRHRPRDRSRMVRASRPSSSRWERIAEAYRASGPASRSGNAASRGRSNPRCAAANRRTWARWPPGRRGRRSQRRSR